MFSLYDILRYQTIRRPGHTALVVGDTHMSYQDLGDSVDRYASTFSGLALEQGARVALLAHNSERFVVAFLALQKLGFVAVLLNWRLEPSELGALMDEARCQVLLHEGDALGREVASIWRASPEGSAIVRDLNAMDDPADRASSLRDLVGRSPARVHPSDECLVFFTSGTSGRSKAAVHTHGGVIAWIGCQAASEWTIGGSDISLVYPPLFHLGGMQIFLHSLVAGASVVLDEGFDADRLLDLAERERVTQLAVIPPSRMLEVARRGALRSRDLSSVKLVLLMGGCNGEPYCEAVFSTFPNASFMHAYGHSENAATCTLVMSRDEYSSHPIRRRSVGQVAAGSLIRLLDDEGTRVASGEPGNAWARSPGMMTGYIDASEPFVDGWFPTGDILRQDEDGYFYFVGRKNGMIKSGGENVSATEVESVIRSHPAVEECVVFGVPDERWGEAVVAAVTLNSGAACSGSELVEYCRTRLASFKRPKRILIVDSVPVTALGKVARAEAVASIGRHFALSQ